MSTAGTVTGVAVEVRTPVFEGPFDLLAQLIVDRRVDIFEVPLAEITAAYLESLDGLGPRLAEATEFLVIASTLVQLKCRRLLPAPPEPELDEELGRWEERDLLLARLIECRTFRSAGEALERLAGRAARSRGRCAGPDERFAHVAPDPLEGVTPRDLRDAAVRALTPRPVPRVDLSHVTPIRVTVGEVVLGLCRRLPALGRARFRELTGHLPRIEVIVHFLAVLELFKQGLVDLHQPELLGDIEVVWVAPDDAVVVDTALVDSYGG